MAEAERPQIYLVTPPDFELSVFPTRLASVLDSTGIACVRLALASRDEDRLSRAADAVRGVTHDRDVALVIDTHTGLAQRLGLDGVHLLDGARSVRQARKSLGRDAIVGAFCGASRHDGMNAAEAGADYVSFGPVAGGLGDETLAEPDLFAWWSDMIEIPVVAEGGLNEAAMATLGPVTDFFMIGDEIWHHEDAAGALGALIAAIP